MHFIEIISRVRNLLLYPAKEWQVVASEKRTRSAVFRQFVVPLLCLITVASVAGSLLFVSRTIFSPGYIIYKLTLWWCVLCLSLFFSSYLIAEMSVQQTGTKNHDSVFALMACSFGPAFLVIATVELFPFFNELSVLSLCSCYLYWRGIPYMIDIKGQKQMIFGILSFVVVTLTGSLLFYLFGNILKSLFKVEIL